MASRPISRRDLLRGVAATGAVLLGGMTFVLLNALLDRTLVGMADAGKNVIAFASGLVLASLLVPVKRRLTDALEKIQYRETYRARRALLDVARDFSAPRPKVARLPCESRGRRRPRYAPPPPSRPSP